MLLSTHTRTRARVCLCCVFRAHFANDLLLFQQFYEVATEGNNGRSLCGGGWGAAGGFDGAPVGIECAVTGIPTGVSEAMCELVLAFGVDGPLSQAVPAPADWRTDLLEVVWCVCVCARSRACANFLHTRTGV